MEKFIWAYIAKTASYSPFLPQVAIVNKGKQKAVSVRSDRNYQWSRFPREISMACIMPFM